MLTSRIYEEWKKIIHGHLNVYSSWLFKLPLKTWENARHLSRSEVWQHVSNPLDSRHPTDFNRGFETKPRSNQPTNQPTRRPHASHRSVATVVGAFASWSWEAKRKAYCQTNHGWKRFPPVFSTREYCTSSCGVHVSIIFPAQLC